MSDVDRETGFETDNYSTSFSEIQMLGRANQGTYAETKTKKSKNDDHEAVTNEGTRTHLSELCL